MKDSLVNRSATNSGRNSNRVWPKSRRRNKRRRSLHQLLETRHLLAGDPYVEESSSQDDLSSFGANEVPIASSGGHSSREDASANPIQVAPQFLFSVGPAEGEAAISGPPPLDASFPDWMEPADIVSFIVELGTALESVAGELDVPGGIPFTSESISQITSFVDQTGVLAKQLYDQATVTGAAEISAANGDLTSDASFVISIDDQDPVFVTLTAESTTGNTSIDDLVVDINTAIAEAGLVEVLTVARGSDADSDKLAFNLVDAKAGTTLKVSTLQVTGVAPAPSSGRLSRDVDLTVTLDTSNLDVPVDVGFTVTAISTESNTGLGDLVRDINAAMNARDADGNPLVDIGDQTALGAVLIAHAVDGAIRFSAVDATAESIVIDGAADLGFEDGQAIDANAAASALGIGDALSATAELAINDFDELIDRLNSVMPVATTLGYDAVNNQATFGLNFEQEYQQEIDLDFFQPLGFADLNIAGRADASVTATAGVNLAVGIDLTRAGMGESIDGATQLSELGKGLVFNVTAVSSEDATSTAGTLIFELDRFDGSSETVSVALGANELDDNFTAEDLVFDLNDYFSAQDPVIPVTASIASGKLVLQVDAPQADQLGVTQLRVTQGAFGFDGTEVSQALDLEITLADNSSAEITLDGATTLAEGDRNRFLWRQTQ